MELLVFIIAVTVVSISSFWLSGFVYGLIRRPAIYFPLSLAIKMALSAVLGSVFMGVGGIILSTLVFNAEMQKRSDYRFWSTILVGVIISLLCSGLILYLVMALAWTVFD